MRTRNLNAFCRDRPWLAPLISRPTQMHTRTIMKHIRTSVLLLTVTLAAATPSSTFAQDLPTISLPKPRREGGKPLLDALKERKSTREFKADKLPLQTVSDLLWAGFGINRPENDHRTAPSAMNSQEVDLYLGTADGLFLYDAKAHALRPVFKEDIRAQTTGQAALKDAPVAIVFVADYARLTKPKPELKEPYAFMDAGFISQNLYLFCASEGLATVVHEVDREQLAKVLKLRADQKAIAAQSVGYPK